MSVQISKLMVIIIVYTMYFDCRGLTIHTASYFVIYTTYSTQKYLHIRQQYVLMFSPVTKVRNILRHIAIMKQLPIDLYNNFTDILGASITQLC